MARNGRSRRPLLVVVARAVETDREGFQPRAGCRDRSRDQCGIDPARQKHPDRHVGDQPRLTAASNRSRRPGSASASAYENCRRSRAKSYQRSTGGLARRTCSQCPAGSLRTPCAIDQGSGTNRSVNSARSAAGSTGRVSPSIASQATSAEPKASRLPWTGRKKRLFAETVARRKERAGRGIPDREGEHADQTRQQSRRPIAAIRRAELQCPNSSESCVRAAPARRAPRRS